MPCIGGKCPSPCAGGACKVKKSCAGGKCGKANNSPPPAKPNGPAQQGGGQVGPDAIVGAIVQLITQMISGQGAQGAPTQ